MNRLGYMPFQEDFVKGLKKELFEANKDKADHYNFDFENEQAIPGRLVWETEESRHKALN